MELRELATFPPAIVDELLRAARTAHERGDTPVDTFNGLPTLVVFRPTSDHPGSLHYMFFPPGAEQQYHYHPGERYLLLIGDIDVIIQHSGAGIGDNPHETSNRTVLQAYTAGAIRLKKETWHKFATSNARGIGVIAFTFHPDDGPESRELAVSGLMEELTVFWQEPASDA
ncbi:MAG TPA: hypothetical protein VGO08_03995 [Burkholderiales bacterium]|jgi:hypothetical protein|nr:hypothetical protein [Burkholderiales bacterium]